MVTLLKTREGKRHSAAEETVPMEKMKAAVAPPSPSPSKKRQQPMKKRSISSNAQSTYVKIRGLLKDVRPYIIEVQYSRSLLFFSIGVFNIVVLHETSWLVF